MIQNIKTRKVDTGDKRWYGGMKMQRQFEMHSNQ